MGSGFSLGRDFEREIMKAAQSGLREVANDYQKMFDSLGRQYSGRPVEAIKPALRREWSKIGGSISDPELTDYATLISEGTHIEMKV